jgi:hypothetical protein
VYVAFGKTVLLGVLLISFGEDELHDQPVSPGTTAGTKPKLLLREDWRGMKSRYSDSVHVLRMLSAPLPLPPMLRIG